jgi:signal peptidase I
VWFYLAVVAIFLLTAGSLPNRRTASLQAAAIATTGLFFVTLRPYSMPSGSMEPTVMSGDRILVDNLGALSRRDPRLGDVVVIHYPVDRKQTFVKRVEGLPGDRIRMENKQLFRNGVAVRAPWAKKPIYYEDSYRDNFPAEQNIPVDLPALQMLKKTW